MKIKICTELFDVTTDPDGVLLTHPKWKGMSAWGKDIENARENLLEAAKEYWLINGIDLRYMPIDMMIFLFFVTAIFELDNEDLFKHIIKHPGLENALLATQQEQVTPAHSSNPLCKTYEHLKNRLNVMNQLKNLELQVNQ